MVRNLTIGCLVGFFLLLSYPAFSTEGIRIPITTDLQKDGRLSIQRKLPILLMVSQDHCPFCDLMKQEILHPMLLSGEYEEKVIMREILIDLGQDVTNFEGKREDAAHFAHGYDVHLSPTLLFLNGEGSEVRKRMIGINTVELFSFYLDAAIDEALAELKPRETAKSAVQP
ncbi:MAG: thioredoxin fold domain-containing protein [Gammaproteobacteria bacterium (ex Lamellibrachia satsuma)]|nr:MAG: thioredoxin fold domain-containing protein [Gammaproteobacteria bacterium (ex Lamellibrachia satsuma)]